MSATTDQIARPNDRGERARALVRHAQQRLQSLGYNLGKLGVDGELYVHEDGSPGFTAKAILDFREAHSLGNQVQVDPDLLAALDDAVKRENETPVDIESRIIKFMANAKNGTWPENVMAASHLWNLQGLGNKTLWSLWNKVTNQRGMLVFTDGDTDTDGLHASTHEDPDAEFDTSLHWPDGTACDSHTFSGTVLPKAVATAYNIELGDVAVSYCPTAQTKIVAAVQFYDGGPRGKIGEFSLAAHRAMGITNTTARIGHSAEDIGCLFFSGSGDGHAWDAAKQLAVARACVERMLS